MSFFTNMFGGSKKKPDPKLQREIQDERDNLQRLKAAENLETKIKQWETKIDSKNQEIANLENQVRTLIKSGKKDRAKVILRKIKGKRDAVVKLNKQVNLLHKQMNTLESSEQDKELFDIIKDTNQVNEKNQQNVENLQEELEKARELEQERQMNDDMLNDLLDQDDDEDDLNDMLADYEKDAALDMENAFNDANKNILPSQPQQQQQAQQQSDGFDDLMAEIMN